MLSQKDNELITRVGPWTPMGRLFRRFWIPAMLSSELPGPDCPPVRVRLLGEDLVAFRDSNGKVGVLGAQCPHRGSPLFFGRNEECGLRCVYHGWKFDVTGQCVDMPNEPAESNYKEKIRQLSYPAQEAGKTVWIYMGPPEAQHALPQLEWTLVPPDHMYVHKRMEACNWLQNLEGEVDSSHISFLHRDLSRGVPDFVYQQGAPTFKVVDTDYGMLIGAQRHQDEKNDYWRITQFLLPSYTMIPNTAGQFLNFTAAVPVDDTTTIGMTVAWRPDRPLSEEDIAFIESGEFVYPLVDPVTFWPLKNKANDYLIDREYQKTGSYTGIRGLRDQDAAVQEGQGLVTDRTAEHLGASDAAVIRTRRLFQRLMADMKQGIEPRAAGRPEAYRVRSAAINLPAGPLSEEGLAQHSHPLTSLSA